MSEFTSQITSLRIVYSTILFRRRWKKTSKLRVTGLCAANSLVTGEFPAQKDSNAEIFSFDDVIHAVCCVFFCFVVGEFYPYPSGSLHWHFDNHTIAPNDQFHKSQNAPVPCTMLHSEQGCAHFCSESSIVGYGTGAFWDMWIRSIPASKPWRIWVYICIIQHDDIIKWKHFPLYWPFVRGIHRWPVNSPHKGQWRGALMFSLICVSMV